MSQAALSIGSHFALSRWNRTASHRIAGMIARGEEQLRTLQAAINEKREILAQQRQTLETLRHQAPFSIRSAVLAILEGFPADKVFTRRDVYNEMKNMPLGFDLEKSHANISTYLRRFTEKGVITIMERGAGQNPTRYRKNERRYA